MLLGAKEVAGTPDLEIAQRDLETLPQLMQPGDDVQPLVRGLREGTARVIKEVGVRSPA